MVFLNGRLVELEDAKVSVLDRGFIFGDGVYELIPVYSRVPFRLDEHLARLERSLAETRIRNPYTRAQWRELVYRLVDAQSFDEELTQISSAPRTSGSVTSRNSSGKPLAPASSTTTS